MKTLQSRIRNRCKLLTILILLLLCVSFLGSGLPAHRSVAQDVRRNCLWSLQSHSNVVYLLGSLHIASPSVHPLSAVIEEAYADSQKIVLETDLTAIQDPLLQAKMLELGLYPEKENLYQNIDGETRRLLEGKMSELRIPSEQFGRFKPWFIALTLASLELQRLGFDPNYGIDIYFLNKAKADGKELGFLEPPEYQFSLFGKMDKQDQSSFLRQTLKDLEQVTDLAEDLVRHWKNGNGDDLHAILFKSFKDHPRIYERLLLQRNREWAGKVVEMMHENQNVLLIVGVGHLVGPGSVVDLLQKKGYKLEQL